MVGGLERHCRTSGISLGLLVQAITVVSRDSPDLCRGFAMRRRSVFRPHLSLPLVLATVVLSAEWMLARHLAADEPKAAAVDKVEKADKAESPAREIPVAARRDGNEKIVALALWFGIVVVGIALLSVIMVWGRSLRAMARRKPKPPTAPDPLWYLKTKPPLPPAPAGSAPGDPSRHGDDGEPSSDISTRTPL